MLAVSSQVEIGGQTLPLTEERKKQIFKDIDDLNSDGMRVIVLAYKVDPSPVGEFTVDDESDLIVIGFLTFLDPPKESAKNALASLNRDGITVKILTGDNEAVTRAVALKVGLNIDTVYGQKDLIGKSDEELAKRKAAWVKPEPKIKTGYLSRYAKLTTSASRGAVVTAD